MLCCGAHQKVISFNNHTVRVVSTVDSRELEDTTFGLEVWIVAVDLCDCPGTLNQHSCFAVIESCCSLVIGISGCCSLEILGKVF